MSISSTLERRQTKQRVAWTTMRHVIVVMVSILLFLAYSPYAFGALGETEEQCKQRYGDNIQTVEYSASQKTKKLIYRELFSADVAVSFEDGIAIEVEHFGQASMTDDSIKLWLSENAQGHEWKLQEVYDTRNRWWLRDDQAFAGLKPYKEKNGQEYLSLTIRRPVPIRPLSSPQEKSGTPIADKIVFVVIAGVIFIPLIVLFAIHVYCFIGARKEKQKSHNQ